MTEKSLVVIMKCHLTGPSLNTLCSALNHTSSSPSPYQFRWWQVPPQQSLGLARFDLKTSDVNHSHQCLSPLLDTCDECLLCRFYILFPVWCDLDHITLLPFSTLMSHLSVSGDTRSKGWAACMLSPGRHAPPYHHHHHRPPPQCPGPW